MPEVELSAGTIEYEDSGGTGPVIVFAHGLFMDGLQWRKVVSELRDEYRCVLPTLPLGAHRRPMRPDADLSLSGQARILSEFLDALGLSDVTLAFNDWSGAQVLIAQGLDKRVGRLVLASCEAFDNYPPGLAGHFAGWASRAPAFMTNAVLQQLRVRALRRLPMTFGWLSKRPVPDEVMDGWLRPALNQREIRRDLRKYGGDYKRGRRDLIAATERLPSFERPVLVVWATEDRIMPPEHGRRLAEIFPDARLVEIADSYTLIPEDQPGELADAIREFVRERSSSAA
jgi:pimeloyl-ACP methyl ester carboxylesterase